MEISLDHVSKRYSNNEWIIKDISHQIEASERVAIVGGNGSGKSTLLKMIAGVIHPSKGNIRLTKDGNLIYPENWYRYLSLCTPYMTLVEELTLSEMIEFHRNFKQLASTKSLIEKMYFGGHKNKAIKDFSSGMKQRLKLGLSIYSNAQLILLDEPTSNMDAEGIAWYQEELNRLDKKTTVLIASNQKYEFENLCSVSIDLGK